MRLILIFPILIFLLGCEQPCATPQSEGLPHEPLGPGVRVCGEMSDLDKGRRIADELGLRITHCGCGGLYPGDIHKLLADAIEVKAGKPEDKEGWLADEMGVHDVYTHSAFLIGIRPIVQEDEATRLLREIANGLENKKNYDLCIIDQTFAERAKALLTKKGKA